MVTADAPEEPGRVRDPSLADAIIPLVTGWNLLPLLLLGVLSFRKVAAPLALTAAALFAGVLVLLQPQVVADFVGKDTGARTGLHQGIWLAMATGFSIRSGIGEVDRLLSRGGMHSMLLTVWLIIGAVTFGTLLEHFGLISRLVDPVIRAARSTGRLFAVETGAPQGAEVPADHART
ncbi:MAG TPA: Na+/H+ antiporter NhaC family protein [Streptosporangiaceae bacterium]|nr:Na+/H+ antiporter NhaC family protein [Streptosporangiaceae bacterium]